MDGSWRVQLIKYKSKPDAFRYLTFVSSHQPPKIQMQCQVLEPYFFGD